MKARILVTGSSTFFATRLIHDLGRRGAEITAADSLRFSAGKSSRFVTRGLTVPRLGTDPGRYLEAILEELDRRPYDLLLPTFEESLLLAEYEADIRRRTRLFLPRFEMMQMLHHKPSLHDLCESLDLPTPPTMRVDRLEQLPLIVQRVGLPAVVKLPAANNAVGRMYCEDLATLTRNFEHLAAQQKLKSGDPPFVQKKIDGELICTLCFCSGGRKLAEVVYRTSRTFPEAGGTAAHRESIHHPEISRIADRIIETTAWSGFLGFDFLVDRQTGVPYLIDANIRANPAVHLGFLSGLDWSRLILDLIADRNPECQQSRAGVHAHNMLLDLSWLLEGLLPGGAPLWKFPQRLARFLAPGWPVHSRDDLIGLWEVGSILAIASRALESVGKSLLSRREPGELLLEDANYNPATAAALRTSLQPALRRAA